MIRLNSEELSKSAAAHLLSVQARINDGADFDQKAERAQTAWDSKSSSDVKKAAFGEIKGKLIAMCVGVEICNYCENNEATDVEHIYPKSFFPERAFRWENYLLACKTCNSGHKLDKFAVFSPAGTDTSVDLIRDTAPATDDGVMIDPRAEDPLQFFWLDIQNKTFILDPRLKLDPRDKRRAEYTLKLLGLNDRDTLVEARKTAAKYYLDRLERYVKARDAATVDELETVVQDPDFINEAQTLEAEKQRICQQIIVDIQTYAHPTVWHELKRQRGNLPKTNSLLNRAPEALNW
ncbi:HNH endonuclease [Spirosoma sp. KUDC1026]|uniref:HNH endonuclease n=1 Tax=Spirosoma sp. KUDC1026 TaxID=2745947 RepID=UPI00159BC95D|nr:HNH endonuclease [Spirosoma sp. KUDC1026]QKZ14267.1 hypothetical protein HU175_17195 [Spirosoma sp. KUDC1026]